MVVTDYPLLVFPAPAVAERSKRSGGGGGLKIPDASRQAQRLAPKFERLQEAMDKQRLAIQDNPLGIQPEQVLVLETVGPIQNFVGAVRRIPGLEWLGEQDTTDILPGDGFEDEKAADRLLDGQLFLVMTDQTALAQIRSFFEAWQRDPDAPFPYGLTPLRHAFAHLRTIRPWGIEDRVRETGILEDWQQRLQYEQDDVPFEAELWFRRSAARRQQSESRLRSIIESLEGRIVQQCVIPDIGYHAILGRLPRPRVQAIVDNPRSYRDIRLLQCEDLMRARPVGQCALPVSNDGDREPLSDAALRQLAQRTNEIESHPRVALFDGMPLTGHRLLDGRLVVDDPDGYETSYQASERVHGTGMASLICHGDLNRRDETLDRLVYTRPILQPRPGLSGQFEETIPDSVLPVDLIHRAVRRLFEGENGEPPIAPAVRVINLSVGDRARPFIREMSAWARLLDWLAWKYHVLFIVSAGNHPQELVLNVSRTEFSVLTSDQRERAVLKALAADTRNRRLLAPAETLNGLTVGAAHEDASLSPVSTHPPIDPFTQPGFPSMVSAHGPGYRRAIKPDLLIPGGRQFVSEKMGTTHPQATIRPHSSIAPPGQRVATPGLPGQLDRTRYSRGTSNAAALATHGANAVLRLLDELRQIPGPPLPPEYDVVLTKTLLAHGAGWDKVQGRYESALKTPDNSRMFKDYLCRFVGYGYADLLRVMTCAEKRVTVLGFGELSEGEGAEFTLPLPPSLLAVNEPRRLTITLAWLSPVNVLHRSYRVAHLWFNTSQAIAPVRRFADHRAVQRGTLQHEVFEGHTASAFQEGDSIVIKVNCREDAGVISESIRYGLAITLEIMEEVMTGLFGSIYAEVRDRLAVRIPLQG